MKRFSIVENGYNIEEVNNFIDIVIRRLEELSKDNNNYLKELEALKEQMGNRSAGNTIDLKVSKALLAAQETTDKMKELAKEEANLIVKEAKENANAIIHEALIGAEKIEERCANLKKNYNVYREKIRSSLKIMSDIINEDDVGN